MELHAPLLPRCTNATGHDNYSLALARSEVGWVSVIDGRFSTQITLTMPWKKVRKLIKEDPRYKNFGDSDHVSTRVFT